MHRRLRREQHVRVCVRRSVLRRIQACEGFTGVICKDNVICVGAHSCYKANVELIARGCNGPQACSYAGYQGSIGLIEDSCIGRYACAYAVAQEEGS